MTRPVGNIVHGHVLETAIQEYRPQVSEDVYGQISCLVVSPVWTIISAEPQMKFHLRAAITERSGTVVAEEAKA